MAKARNERATSIINQMKKLADNPYVNINYTPNEIGEKLPLRSLGKPTQDNLIKKKKPSWLR